LQLNTYLENRIDQEAPLFVNQDYQKLTKSSIENSWKRISSELNVNFSSMDLRKTSAVLFAMSGASNEELKKLYGFKTNSISNKYFFEGKNRLALEKQRSFSPIK
jgi:site-specific recombinase XerD